MVLPMVAKVIAGYEGNQEWIIAANGMVVAPSSL